jgi:hypothetical protein
MGKNNKIRILIKKDNNYYRLFTVIHHFDNHKEPYIKISVPDIQKKQLIIKDVKKYVSPIDQDNLLKDVKGDVINSLHELSYHYQTGIIHFKNIYDRHLYQMKDIPILHNEKFLLVTRLVFNDLSIISEYKKKITSNDIILQLPFNNLCRLFEIYLHEDINVRLENDKTELTRIGGYKLNIQGSNTHILIEEYCYSQKKFKPKNIMFSFFLPKDPKIVRNFNKLAQ